ncbi:DUF4126 domain-containing protein [Humidisolicoccus flavus]|uniref:DUF4126 domain-containing protein n=1 Tax=Humidisolicoccus flavus TaxID=3111414 RepID=UPI0032533833
MFEFLTGSGLAAAAGLNAYVPLLAVGVANRFFPEALNLPEGWSWLSNGWVLVILVVLLIVEFVADKIPAVDSINDIIQTIVRPTSGGLVFGSSSGATSLAVTDPAAFFQSNQWVPIVVGVVIALAVHGTKAAARPAANLATLGVAAPLVSTAEDAASIGLTLAAILAPLLVIIGLIALVWVGIYLIRKRRARARFSERFDSV